MYEIASRCISYIIERHGVFQTIPIRRIKMSKKHSAAQLSQIADIMNVYLDYSITRDSDSYNVLSQEDFEFLTQIKNTAFIPEPPQFVITPVTPTVAQAPSQPHRIVPLLKHWKRDWKSGTVYNENDCRNIIRDYITYHCQQAIQSGSTFDAAFDALMASKDWKGHAKNVQNTKTGVRIKGTIRYTVVLKKLIPPFTQKKGNKSHHVLSRIIMN